MHLFQALCVLALVYKFLPNQHKLDLFDTHVSIRQHTGQLSLRTQA